METLIWGVFFGIIGMGYFSFGRKQDRLVFMLTGVGLMLFPYFIGGVTAMISTGVLLLVLPFMVGKISR